MGRPVLSAAIAMTCLLTTSAFMPAPMTSSTTTTTTTTTTTLYATGDKGMSRRDLAQQGFQGLLFSLALTSAAPRVVTALEDSPNRALVTCLRISTLIKNLLQDLPTSDVVAPQVLNTQIKYMARDLDMGNNINLAALAISDTFREEARKHGRESFEYLSQIVEFAGYDRVNKPGVSSYSQGIPSERLDFVLKALSAADKELSQFLAAFDSTTMARAKEIYKDVFPA